VNVLTWQAVAACRFSAVGHRRGRQLQRAGSVQLDTSRRSSMSDIIIEDIDGNFVELNDKVDGAQSYADVCDYVVL